MPLSRFFAANTTASLALERRFDWQSDKPFWAEFEARVADLVKNSSPGEVLVDLGGGRRCVWHAAVPATSHLVAVDIDQAELDANEVVVDKRLGDVGSKLPLLDQEADLLVSRALLEHVADVPTAIAEMARVLKPGGRAIHFVPARNSLFGIAARLGPFGLLKKLVHKAIPSAVGQVEFPVFYDNCTAESLEQLFRAAGFASVNVKVCYSQSGYFHPILPVYIIVAAYQGIVARLGLRQLAAYVIVDAVR
jgi:ubiquinone/menaquinone biosynthesis C-methylase UbiE